ncbi:hypothetical protein DL93DRAFT_1933463 [Clavulina sp. PMI_390]|nr:hypothetical protein DL93DRAFT_1933463 [Clavulina sp. PMI_390]
MWRRKKTRLKNLFSRDRPARRSSLVAGNADDVVRDLASVGAAMAPPLEVVASSTGAILDVIKSSKLLQKRLRVFGAQLQSSMNPVIQYLEAEPPAVVSEPVAHLDSALRDIRAKLMRITQRSAARRLLTVRRDSEILDGCHDELDKAVRIFHVETALLMNQAIAEVSADARSNNSVARNCAERVDNLSLQLNRSIDASQHQAHELQDLSRVTSMVSSRNFRIGQEQKFMLLTTSIVAVFLK